jgi:hypothetical protein
LRVLTRVLKAPFSSLIKHHFLHQIEDCDVLCLLIP